VPSRRFAELLPDYFICDVKSFFLTIPTRSPPKPNLLLMKEFTVSGKALNARLPNITVSILLTKNTL